MSARKLALMSILTAAALIVFIIEAQVPIPVPIPGAKLGLANAVTLFALFLNPKEGFKKSPVKASIKDSEKDQKKENAAPALTVADVFMILVCRIILGAVFSGRFVAFIYSISGGLLGFAAVALLKGFVADKQIWVCGVAGAVFHNIGQIVAAMLVMGTPAIAALLPAMTIIAIITGAITGLAAQYTAARLNRVKHLP